MTPSAALAASNAVSGNVVPDAASGCRPTATSSKAKSMCQSLADARNTASVAWVISGPMPSPCMTQRRTGDVLGEFAIESFFFLCPGRAPARHAAARPEHRDGEAVQFPAFALATNRSVYVLSRSILALATLVSNAFSTL